MIRVIHKTSTVLVLAIGVIHTVGTFFFYEGLSDAAIWFSGAGLCAIFVALINTALWLPDATVQSRRLAGAAKFLFLLWLAAGVSATPALPQLLVVGTGAIMVVSAALLGLNGKV